MAIQLPKGLPAEAILRAEGISVTGADISPARPLRIALLNLMPQKTKTEAQIARLLGSTPFPVELTLVVPGSYRPKNTHPAHIAGFYETWPNVRERHFDGLIVTGAPVETLEFEEVDYWRELTEIFDWSQTHVQRSYYICWAAQAALYHFHGVPKRALQEKLFGVFPHRVRKPESSLLMGFDGEFIVPVSRHTEVRSADLPDHHGLEVLAESAEAGLCLIEDTPRRAAYMFNHLEYDSGTLRDEYFRDVAEGREIEIPKHYFPDDDPSLQPVNGWRPYGHLLFRNWLDEIARSRVAGNEHGQMVDWLLAERRRFTVVGECNWDFLLFGDDDPDRLPRLLRWLADRELSPHALKVHKQPAESALIELRLNCLADTSADSFSRALLKVEGTRRVAFRSTNGAGGILVNAYPCPDLAEEIVSKPRITAPPRLAIA